MHIECPNCECDDYNEPEPTFFDRETIERVLECKACFTRYRVRYEAVGSATEPEVTEYRKLHTLAENAKPQRISTGGHDDWGSERQVEAENAFWQFVESLVSVQKYNDMTTEIECNHMTSEESIRYGIDVAEWALKAKQAGVRTT